MANAPSSFVEVHAPESARRPCEARAPAHRVDRTARQSSAERFAHAVDAAGSSLAAVGRAWGVDASIVADVRDGARPLTWERINALPRSVERALLEARLAELNDDAPASAQAPSRHVLRLTRLVGTHASVVEEAERDGVVTQEELEEIERSLLPLTDATMLARRDARAGRSGR